MIPIEFDPEVTRIQLRNEYQYDVDLYIDQINASFRTMTLDDPAHFIADVQRLAARMLPQARDLYARAFELGYPRQQANWEAQAQIWETMTTCGREGMIGHGHRLSSLLLNFPSEEVPLHEQG